MFKACNDIRLTPAFINEGESVDVRWCVEEVVIRRILNLNSDFVCRDLRQLLVTAMKPLPQKLTEPGGAPGQAKKGFS
jgi:hypothetical protein